MKRKGSPPPSPLAVIADHALLGGALAGEVEKAHAGGVRWIVLRAKELQLPRRAELAAEIMEAAPGLVLSVHGGPEGVALPGFGVHHQASLIEKCAEAGPGTLAGASCHDGAELTRAEASGADYVFLSPFAKPFSKETLLKPLGPEGIGEAARRFSVPVYALGGVEPGDAERLKAAGAAGLAVSGGIFKAGEVKERARLYVECVLKVFGKV